METEPLDPGYMSICVLTYNNDLELILYQLALFINSLILVKIKAR